jgi:hypothetical protein
MTVVIGVLAATLISAIGLMAWFPMTLARDIERWIARSESEARSTER